jgi:hypothetical protein
VCLLWLLVAPVPGAPNEESYERLITTAAHEQGLDPALVKAVIKCESGFNPHAQSRRGAQGLMQIIPSTQAMLGVNDPFDPQENVTGGTRYLAMLQQMFSRDLRLALAAYNAGPQRVVDAGHTVPAISETQQYVRCVLAAYAHYSQPDAPTLVRGDQSLLAPGEARRALGLTTARFTASSPGERRRTLMVTPLRLSSQGPQLGQRLTVHVEAINTSTRPAQGIVMVHYPEHLVSFMALHTTEYETLAQREVGPGRPTALAVPATPAYQLLWGRWSSWAPGERRTALIALVPRVPQEIMLHVSVELDEAAAPAALQHWSATVRIPCPTAGLVAPDTVASTLRK